MMAAISDHGRFMIAHHCSYHAGGASFSQRDFQRCKLLRGISSNFGFRSIFCAMTACIAKLRASSRRCIENAGRCGTPRTDMGPRWDSRLTSWSWQGNARIALTSASPVASRGSFSTGRFSPESGLDFDNRLMLTSTGLPDPTSASCIDNVITTCSLQSSLSPPLGTLNPMKSSSSAATKRDDLIQIRASAATKAILNRAAALRGQKLSEFMLDSARARAEETILDQRLITLDEEAYKAFLAMLDAPAKPNKALRTRMSRKLAWER